MVGLTATCTHGTDRGERLRKILETKVIPLERLMIGMHRFPSSLFLFIYFDCFFLFFLIYFCFFEFVCVGSIPVDVLFFFSFIFLLEYFSYTLVTETDAPFMLPHNIPSSFNHTIDCNEPSLLWCVCDTLSQIYGVSADVIAEHTTRNSLRFFGLTL